MPSKNKEIRLPGSLLKFGIGLSQTEKLKKIGRIRLLPKGKALLSIGSHDRVFILTEGSAEIFAKDADGDLYPDRSVSIGEVLGLTESIANTPSDTYVYGVTDCKFTLVPRDEFIEFLRQEPDTCLEFALTIARRLLEISRTTQMSG